LTFLGRPAKMIEVRRVRLGVAGLLAVAAGGICLVVATVPGTASGSRGSTFHYTHRFSVSGELVDHWTFHDSAPCGAVGDGVVTVKFHMTSAPRVRLVVDPVKNGEPNNTLGSWVLGVPAGAGIGDLRSQPAAGTITRVDNTEPGPDPSGGICDPIDKSGCGTKAFSKARSSVGGYNRRFLIADLEGVSWEPTRSVVCRVGENTLFTDGRLTGGTPLRGELLLKMPSPLVVAHRRVLTVTGTSSGTTTYKNCDSPGVTCSDVVTRRVTVVFKRL
jgi:hypothetical protein